MVEFKSNLTKVEIKIEGHIFNTDLTRDEITVAIIDNAKKIKEIKDSVTDANELLEKIKKTYKHTINAFLSDESASSKIFASNDGMLFHEEVFTFLNNMRTSQISKLHNSQEANKLKYTHKNRK